jgi:uncharacterized protein YeaO (DUF488 family)
VNLKLDTYRYGEPRRTGEGLRIGVTRRPPRGVKESDWAARDYLDAWLRVLSPSEELLASAQGSNDPKVWAAFRKRYTAEMKGSNEARNTIRFLALLARERPLSLGCFCDRDYCHRFILKGLVEEAADGRF